MSGRTWHLRFMLTVSTAVLCLIDVVSAQPRGEPEARARAERFRDQVVRVLTETTSDAPGEPGFGIIVGEADRIIYIATPYHVAFGRDPRNTKVKDTPSVLFYTNPNARPTPGRRLDKASPQDLDDLAVLEVPAPAGFSAPRIPMMQADKLLIGSWVWNIGIGGEWELPYRAGGLGTIDPVSRWLRVGSLRTPGGSSGGAAVTEDGILGMVERDGEAYSFILPIERVAELFRAWRLPVNLLEISPTQSAPATAQSMVSPVPTALLAPSAPVAPPAPPPAAAATPRAGERLSDCATCPEMVTIPAGSFQMSSPPGENGRDPDEGPQRRVAIAAFAAGRYEATFAEWDACAAAGGCGSYRPADEGWGRGNRPVINVSWQDAQSYVTWLSGQTKRRYRLLTEAKWEYAARAGTATPFSTGAQIRPDQAQYSWTLSYAGSATRASSDKKTVPVGSFPANGFGLHDVHGNVKEWVEDCYDTDMRGLDPAYDPAKYSCSARLVRGGSWVNGPKNLRSAGRSWSSPDQRDDFTGFRVARTL